MCPDNLAGISAEVVGRVAALARGDSRLAADKGVVGRRDVGGTGLISSDSG